MTALALSPVALSFAILGRRFDEDGGPRRLRARRLRRAGVVRRGLGHLRERDRKRGGGALGLTRAVLPGVGRSPARRARAAAAVSPRSWPWCARGLALRSHLDGPHRAQAPAAGRARARLPAPRRGRAARADAAAASRPRGARPASWRCSPPGVRDRARDRGAASARRREPSPSPPSGSLALAAVLYVVLQTACVARCRAWPPRARPWRRRPPSSAARARRAVAAGTSVSALGIAFGMMVTTPVLSLGARRRGPAGPRPRGHERARRARAGAARDLGPRHAPHPGRGAGPSCSRCRAWPC